MTRQIYSKLLLFGEYAILEGGNALSLSNKNMYGNLALDAEGQGQMSSHESLKLLAEFLEENFYEYFDFDNISRDLSNGLFFESNIPQGYGAGSSGALLAAFLHEFGKNLPNELHERKNLFADMESFFHGKSSGLDVLVCYENASILIENQHLRLEDTSENALFSNFDLIDSQSVGITSHLVEQFNAQGEAFKNAFVAEYVPASNNCISHFLAQNESALFQEMKILSRFAYEHMPWTIPNGFKAAWKASLDDDLSVMKLCGSGGGGFVINYKLG